jgi:hypothetical protein
LIALVRSWSVDVSFLWSDPFLLVSFEVGGNGCSFVSL